LCLLTLGGISGCKSGDKELVGFGKYKIGETTPADSYVMGKCRPEGSETFCFLNRSPSIAGHKTQTDLYFRGHEEKAPLIEIQVGVWNCQPGPVSADLQSKLGDPTQIADKRAMWALKKMTVIALLPKDKELCMVHFLAPTESKRIASLFPPAAQSAAAQPSAAQPSAAQPSAPATEVATPSP
jgi:hypothetical protein